MNSVRSTEIELRNQQLVLYFEDGFFVLVGGDAYVCCASLTPNKKYSFTSTGVKVDAPQYARLRICAKFTILQSEGLEYSINPVIATLDVARCTAKATRTTTEGKINHSSVSSSFSSLSTKSFCRGPRVLIVGSAQTGKTYTTISLANSATRSQEFKVGVFDLDVGRQAIGSPGCISCIPVEEPLPLVSPFSQLSSLSFFFGLLDVPQKSKERYLTMCRSCADIFAYHAEEDEALDCGGMIISTMRYSKDSHLPLICEVALLFDVTHVVLTERNLKLEEALRSATVVKRVQFLHVNSSPNFVRQACKMREYDQHFNTLRIKQYFEGTVEQPLKPVRLVCATASVKFYDAATYKLLPPRSVPERSLCSVSKLDVPPDDVQHSSSAGFIVILEVGDDFFSFLAPQAGSLYTNHIVVSSLIALPVEEIPPFEEI